MKRYALFLIALTACTGPAQQASTTPTGERMTPAEQLHAALTARLQQSDFQQIDGGGPIGGVQSLYYVTTKSREEVLEILTPVIEPYTRDVPWTEDYGQYHIGLSLKDQPDMRFGIGISFVKPKTDTYKNQPDILKNYETDIVYTPPYEWNEP